MLGQGNTILDFQMHLIKQTKETWPQGMSLDLAKQLNLCLLDSPIVQIPISPISISDSSSIFPGSFLTTEIDDCLTLAFHY